MTLNLIFDLLKYWGVTFIAIIGAYKTITELSAQKTKRKEIEAKESSVGAAAITLIKEEIEILQKARLEDDMRIKNVENIIKSLQFILEILERGKNLKLD